MAEVNESGGAAQGVRRPPNVHSEAVQEAKRRQKLQTISSSHRFSGPADRPAPAKAAAPEA